jgi:hypothetical protein
LQLRLSMIQTYWGRLGFFTGGEQLNLGL